MAYQFSQQELAVLQVAYSNALIDGSWSSVYAVTSASITTNGSPDTGVDAAVLAWVNGALQVNANVGVFSHFIRTYSTTQYEIRFGEPSTTSLQSVSDAVARAVADDILETGLLPSLDTIGDKDAGATIAGYFQGDPGGFIGRRSHDFVLQ